MKRRTARRKQTRNSTSRVVTWEAWNGLVRRFGRRCLYCGERRGRTLCVDHVEPESRGGEDDLANIVVACTRCNSSKGNMFLLEWVMWKHGLMKRSYRYKYIKAA